MGETNLILTETRLRIYKTAQFYWLNSFYLVIDYRASSIVARLEN